MPLQSHDIIQPHARNFINVAWMLVEGWYNVERKLNTFIMSTD